MCEFTQEYCLLSSKIAGAVGRLYDIRDMQPSKKDIAEAQLELVA